MFFRSLICIFGFSTLLASSQLNAANSYYEQAVQAYHEGKYESSFIYLKNALDAQPRNLPAKILMGKIFLHRGYFKESINQFEEALEYKADINLIIADYATALNFDKRFKDVLAFSDGYQLNKSSQLELLINKGIAYQNLDLTELSRKAYRKATSLVPYDTRAMNSLASLELSLKNLDEASRLVSKSIEVNPNDHRTLHLKGQISFTLNDYNGAISSYLAALEILNDDPVVRRSLISAYIKAGELIKAKKLINEVLAVTPEDPHMMLLTSWMLSINQQDEDATTMLESLSSTTSLIPEDEFLNNPSLIFVTALSSYLQGNIEQATKELTKYLSAVPGDLRAISMLTNVYMKQGKAREAGYLLERHEAAVVGNLKLAIRLADLYLTNGQKFEAEMLLEKLEIEYPNELDVTLRLVSIYNQSGRTTRARSLIEKVAGDETDIRLDIARGLMYLQNGSVDEAFVVAERLAQKYPESFDMLNFKSAVLIKQNKPQEAQPIIIGLLEQRPDFFEAKFNLATTHKMLGDTAPALDILKVLHEDRPSHKDVKYMLAQSYVEVKDFEAAISLLETVTTKNTGRMSQELLFDIYMETKEYQNALRVMKSLNDTHLYNPDYLFKLVSVLNILNRNDDAVKHLGVLYGLAENNSRMLFDVAVWQRKIEDYASAQKTLEKLQKLLPKNLRVKVESVRLLLSQGQVELAMQVAEKLGAEVGDEPNVLVLLGDIETVQKDFFAAHSYYWRALKRDENFNLALMNLYQIAQMGIEVAKFELISKQLIEKNPKQLWRNRLLADHYMNTMKFNQAKPIYDDLVKQPGFKEDAFLLNNMALIYLETSLDDALIYVRKAFDLNDTNSSIRDTLGWVYYKLQRYDEALELLRSAHAMDSQDGTIRYHLANVLVKLNRKTEAKIELNSAIARGKDEPWFESAKILLSQL